MLIFNFFIYYALIITMKNRSSLKVNAIFNTIYQILILIVPLITTPYISRVLGASNNGIYANFYSLVQYFVLVTTFGFVDYGTKAIAEKRDSNREKTINFYSIYIAKIILGFICLVFYIVTILTFFKKSDWLFALCFSVYIFSAMIDPLFYFQGEEKFVSICIRNLILKVISTICVFIFVRSENDLFIYTIILGLSQLLSIIIIFPGIKFKNFEKVSLKDLNIKKSLICAFPYFVPSLAVTLFSYVNQTLIGFLGGNDEESGYFAQSVKIIQILACIPSSLNILMLSRISYLNSVSNEVEIRRKIKKTLEAFWIISWPILFGLCGICSIFIPIFLGEGYESCIVLIYIMCPTIILGPLNGLYGNLYFRPKNKIWTQTYIILFSALLNLILCFILIPSLGGIGTSIGRIVAEFMQLPLLMFFSRKYMDNKMVFKVGIKSFFSSSVMFIMIYFLKNYLVIAINNSILILIILILAGIIIYLISELILKEEFLITNLKLVFNTIIRHNKRR